MEIDGFRVQKAEIDGREKPAELQVDPSWTYYAPGRGPSSQPTVYYEMPAERLT